MDAHVELRERVSSTVVLDSALPIALRARRVRETLKAEDTAPVPSLRALCKQKILEVTPNANVPAAAALLADEGGMVCDPNAVLGLVQTDAEEPPPRARNVRGRTGMRADLAGQTREVPVELRTGQWDEEKYRAWRNKVQREWEEENAERSLLNHGLNYFTFCDRGGNSRSGRRFRVDHCLYTSFWFEFVLVKPSKGQRWSVLRANGSCGSPRDVVGRVLKHEKRNGKTHVDLRFDSLRQPAFWLEVSVSL